MSLWLCICAQVCVTECVCVVECSSVISHVSCWPHMGSLGPLARQIFPLLSASVNTFPQMSVCPG